jgi:hypothetical protein
MSMIVKAEPAEGDHLRVGDLRRFLAQIDAMAGTAGTPGTEPDESKVRGVFTARGFVKKLEAEVR